ncbi:hypothetical protein [Nocardia asteroides]|uniref:hypothetical protein n=1 Tax=Nocardia asteroides TaxID=1824 RepID=UPI00343DEF53
MAFVADPDPGTELQAWLSERVAWTNAAAAQVSKIAVFGSKAVPQKSTGSAARADYLDWVDPAQIVSTPDHEQWGSFDRSEPTRRTLAEACLALHQASTLTELEAWIDRRWIGGTTQPGARHGVMDTGTDVRGVDAPEPTAGHCGQPRL